MEGRVELGKEGRTEGWMEGSMEGMTEGCKRGWMYGWIDYGIGRTMSAKMHE